MKLGASAAKRRWGFTFIEVMFAVLILAFGVIMIAAMLPVALRETQRTRDTNAGSSIVEGGFHTEEMAWATSNAFERGNDASTVPPPTMPATVDPATGETVPVTFPAYGWNYAFPVYTATDWQYLQFFRTLGNRVNSVDGTYAYIPFYARTGTAAPQVAVLAVGIRNIESMRNADASASDNPFLQPGAFFGHPESNGSFTISDNCPLLVDIEFDLNAAVSSDGSSVDKIEPDMITMNVPSLATGSVSLPGDHDERLASAAVKGGALVLVNDNGDLRILRLGDRFDDETFIFQLAPGGDTEILLPAGSGAGTVIVADGTNPAGSENFQEFNDKDSASGTVMYRGYLVGRMLDNPGSPLDPDNPYVGPSQVVQVLEGRTLP